MVKGVSIRFKSYEETIRKLLDLIKFNDELKKHEKVVLKPNLIEGKKDLATKVEFIEPILKYCMEHKNPGSEIFIAEGCDGEDTMEVFDELGYTALAEKYDVGLVDLNRGETEEINHDEFLRFDSIMYPKILLESFVISLPSLDNDEEMGIRASLDNMLGAFPAKHYSGFFSTGKNKIRKWSVAYRIHDIIKCKMPDFAIVDASEREFILAGKPLEMDKQAAKALGLDHMELKHIRLIEESLSPGEFKEEDLKE